MFSWLLSPALDSDFSFPSCTLFSPTGSTWVVLKPLSFVYHVLFYPFRLDCETVAATVKGEIHLWEYVLVHFLFLSYLPVSWKRLPGRLMLIPSIYLLIAQLLSPSCQLHLCWLTWLWSDWAGGLKNDFREPISPKEHCWNLGCSRGGDEGE